MIRNLKTLGLALAAVSALSSVAATAATAQQGEFTSDGPVTMKATENAGTTNALTAFGLTVKCPETTYTGHKYNVTPHELLPNDVTTATVTPHYKQVAANGDANCRATPGNFPITVHMNGCDYVVHLGATTEKANTYAATLDIVCPAGKEITLTGWTTDHEHTTGLSPFCVLHIPPQTGLTGAHFTDTTNGTVDVSGALESMKATKTNNTGAADTHTVICPETTSTTASFHVNVTTKGLNGEGGSTSVGISE
jgi:hypothetical protein